MTVTLDWKSAGWVVLAAVLIYRTAFSRGVARMGAATQGRPTGLPWLRFMVRSWWVRRNGAGTRPPNEEEDEETTAVVVPTEKAEAFLREVSKAQTEDVKGRGQYL